jgi:hypothetical protein
VKYHFLESENMMNENLTKYLSDVFRNDVKGNLTRESMRDDKQAGRELVDRNVNQFLLDKRFSLRLDEII